MWPTLLMHSGMPVRNQYFNMQWTNKSFYIRKEPLHSGTIKSAQSHDPSSISMEKTRTSQIHGWIKLKMVHSYTFAV